MKRSGHKTRSVFDRYNIVSEADNQEAARKIEAYRKYQTVTEMVTVQVSVSQKVVNLENKVSG